MGYFLKLKRKKKRIRKKISKIDKTESDSETQSWSITDTVSQNCVDAGDITLSSLQDYLHFCMRNFNERPVRAVIPNWAWRYERYRDSERDRE